MEIHLKELRRRAGLSQEEIAARLGIKKSRYGTWERGERMLNLEQAFNCAVVLDCTIDEIAGLDRARLRRNDPYEGELVECYRAATAEGKANILGNARGQRELSLKTSERGGHETGIEEMSA